MDPDKVREEMRQIREGRRVSVKRVSYLAVGIVSLSVLTLTSIITFRSWIAAEIGRLVGIVLKAVTGS